MDQEKLDALELKTLKEEAETRRGIDQMVDEALARLRKASENA
jgi:hypothetical protein